MKDKALTFVIGLLVGIILSTIGFVIYNNLANKNADFNTSFEVHKKDIIDMQDNANITTKPEDNENTIVDMQEKNEFTIIDDEDSDKSDEVNDNISKEKKYNIVNMQNK